MARKWTRSLQRLQLEFELYPISLATNQIYPSEDKQCLNVCLFFCHDLNPHFSGMIDRRRRPYGVLCRLTITMPAAVP